MSVELAKSAGYCAGVRMAVQKAMDAPAGEYVTLGAIIHNKNVELRLEERDTYAVNSVEEVPEGRGVIIRSHGVTKAVYDELERRGIDYIDATCPHVRRIHEIAMEESRAGRRVIVIGDPDHPEVQGILGWCRGGAVVSCAEDVDRLLRENPRYRDAPVSTVCQTTNTRAVYENCVNKLKKECTNLKNFDTICGATRKRQKEAAEIASRSDVMVVVGDRSSSNTRKLYDICRENCPRTLFAESAGDIKPGCVRACDNVGITAGASAPGWIIKEVYDKMSDEIIKNAVGEEPAEVLEEDFASMLEGAIKTLNTGDKVTGIVTAITPTEVYVDLGTKHAGIIPVEQLSDDPNAKVEDIVKVGDEIECFTVRVNDVEGTAMLSKKRLDAEKNWVEIEEACENKTTVEGIVTEENKGGIVVNVKGIRVFVPASQTGVPRGGSLTELLKTKVQLRITEVNRARRRVVGSIRAVTFEARKAAAEKIWNEIEVGKEYKGTVKSLTSYGAFVDIGGIDGMVHVSELSWSRIKSPADVLSVGDEVDVYVISFDPEKKKISLGYKGKGENPWTVFTTSHNVGDVIDVKIVKLMPFGAFAEIIPGVDGLIHISQIADRRINKPEDVLAEGETVTVKITDIDMEKKKVSLSIRALLSDEGEAEGSEEE